MKKYNFPPLIMTIPGAITLMITASVLIAMILLPRDTAEDFAMTAAPFALLSLLVMVVGFVLALAKPRI